MSDENKLPPLPEPTYHAPFDGVNPLVAGYTAEQMHAYASARDAWWLERLQELERRAELQMCLIWKALAESVKARLDEQRERAEAAEARLQEVERERDELKHDIERAAAPAPAPATQVTRTREGVAGLDDDIQF